ncbi:MAG: energy transducer TonB [Sandaracinaceae bacterium]
MSSSFAAYPAPVRSAPPAPVPLLPLLAFSLLAHVLIWLGLTLLPSIEDMLAHEQPPVEITVLPPPPPVEEEVVEEETVEPEVEVPPPPPDPEPVRERTPRVRNDDPPPEPDPTPPAAEEAIADFSGETLTNDSGEAWQSNVGNGQAMQGPIGQPNAQVTGRHRTGNPNGRVGGTGTGDEGPTIVPVSDLSRRPGPPATRLIELLRANMPRRNRELGQDGDAVIRIRVGPDGRVVPLAIVREDHEGLGEACRQSVRESGSWDAPLDRNGDPVTTVTTFRCTFTLN